MLSMLGVVKLLIILTFSARSVKILIRLVFLLFKIAKRENEMIMQSTSIGNIPAILWGNASNRLYLYVHGQGGNKEEASFLAEKICPHGWQVLSFDLPEHGDRKDENDSFNPWHIVPELNFVMQYVKSHWKQCSLYATSIGAWFSMLSFGQENIATSLFVSPVLDMKQLILKMMCWANVTEEQLRSEKIIPTSFGQTLTWDYWQYTVNHPILAWNSPTRILYGEYDNMIDYSSIEDFSKKYHCAITVMEHGEHWFHTEQQMTFLGSWISNNFQNKKMLKFER